MFSRHLAQHGHTREFLIQTVADGGWEVREEADRHVVRQIRYTDWHRVERARTMFSLRVRTLKQEGWIDVAGEPSPPQDGPPKARAAGYSTNR
jgi:hypothetical protein